MAFVKQTMANAAGYFFDLALETTVPELKAAKDFLQKMAADINRFNMSSCQAAKAMVDSVASLWGESQQNVCQSVGGQTVCFRTGLLPVRAVPPEANTAPSRTKPPARKRTRY
jgi:conjugative transfer pilus assembly protein TraH